MAGKDAGEKQLFRLTPLLRFLPYYLISNSVPFLITHQVLPRNYGYVIRHKVKIWSSSLILLIYLYQTFYIPVKENFKNLCRHKICNQGISKNRPKGYSNRLKHDLILFSSVLVNAKNDQ